MDSRSAPEWIRRDHSADQGFDLDVDRRATAGGPGGELGPVLAEATPLPPQDGVGSHHHEGLPPAGPDSGQPDPEQPIRCAEFRPGHRSLVDGELLAQGEVLQDELAVAAPEEGEETEQVEEEGDHQARILARSAPQINHLPAGRSFGEGQADQAAVSAMDRLPQDWTAITPGPTPGQPPSQTPPSDAP